MSSRKCRKKHTTKSLGDVTLNDFANSSVCINRPKKSANNVTTIALKEIVQVQENWEENVEDFEGDVVEVVHDDGTVTKVIGKATRKNKRTASNSVDEDTREFVENTYPIDIWFLLSKYIRPEDVGRFAAICKTSHEVVQSANFWYNLYKRYYKPSPNIPEELRPQCVVRKFGLRVSVIRALQYVYPPFISRITAIKPIRITGGPDHPDTLIRMLCLSVWWNKKAKFDQYYFKLQQKQLQRRTYIDKAKSNLLDMLDDVYSNQDEYCRVLQVTSTNRVPLPEVAGLTLTSVSIRESTPFEYRLQLGFGSGINTSSSSIGSGSSVNVVLEPVRNLKVLDWWHPRYPRSHSMEHLLNQE